MAAEKQIVPLTPDQQRAYEELSPEGQAVFRKIRAKAFSLAKLDIMTRWEIGEIVREVTNNERKYGKGIVEQLAKALGGENSQNELYQYRLLANTYTKEHLERLINRPMFNGNQIAWSHLRLLISIDRDTPSSEVRAEMTELLYTEHMTAATLADRIRKRLAGENGDVAPLHPKSPAAAMQQADKYCQAVVSRVPVWEESIFKRVMETPPDQISPKMLEQLEAFAKNTQESSEVLLQTSKKAADALERLKRVASKSETAAPVAAQSGRAHDPLPKIQPVRPALRNAGPPTNVTRAAEQAKSRAQARVGRN